MNLSASFVTSVVALMAAFPNVTLCFVGVSSNSQSKNGRALLATETSQDYAELLSSTGPELINAKAKEAYTMETLSELAIPNTNDDFDFVNYKPKQKLWQSSSIDDDEEVIDYSIAIDSMAAKELSMEILSKIALPDADEDVDELTLLKHHQDVLNEIMNEERYSIPSKHVEHELL